MRSDECEQRLSAIAALERLDDRPDLAVGFPALSAKSGARALTDVPVRPIGFDKGSDAAGAVVMVVAFRARVAEEDHAAPPRASRPCTGAALASWARRRSRHASAQRGQFEHDWWVQPGIGGLRRALYDHAIESADARCGA